MQYRNILHKYLVLTVCNSSANLLRPQRRAICQKNCHTHAHPRVRALVHPQRRCFAHLHEIRVNTRASAGGLNDQQVTRSKHHRLFPSLFQQILQSQLPVSKQQQRSIGSVNPSPPPPVSLPLPLRLSTRPSSRPSSSCLLTVILVARNLLRDSETTVIRFSSVSWSIAFSRLASPLSTPYPSLPRLHSRNPCPLP